MSRRTSRRTGAGLLASALLFAACADSTPGGGGDEEDPQAGITTVTFRLWDETAASAYRESFDAFTATHRDVVVDVEVEPWETYWTQLADDIEAGTAPDVFWTNTANVEQYVDTGALLDVGATLGEDHDEWQPAVVDLYTHDDALWGVPQLWDAVVLYYNAGLVEEAGVDPADLTWRPVDDAADDDEPAGDDVTAPAPDTLLPAAARLTRDEAGNTAADADFDPASVVQYGFNAEPDLQAILLPFLAQSGAEFQSGTELAFDSPEGVAAIEYLSDLVNMHHVAPPVDPAATADAGLTAFLDGELALFQSGPYHLRRIAAEAEFDWEIAPVVAGPQGRVSLVHGVAAAASSSTENLREVSQLLGWIGSADGQLPLASQGIALPGAVRAESAFLDYWRRAGVDVSPFLDAAAGELTAPPRGPAVQAGLEALLPILADALAGELPSDDAVAAAQQAANEAQPGQAG